MRQWYAVVDCFMVYLPVPLHRSSTFLFFISFYCDNIVPRSISVVSCASISFFSMYSGHVLCLSFNAISLSS